MQVLKTDVDELQVGDWCFLDTASKDGWKFKDAYIAVRFLDGDRGLAILPVFDQSEDEPDEMTVQRTNTHGQACWEWNGSKATPTLSPSILHWGDDKGKPATWHGFLRDGKLVLA